MGRLIAKHATTAALSVYLLWVAATWLLEGWPQTLLRPEATGLRLAYALIANLAIGIVLPLWLLRHKGASARRSWSVPLTGGAAGYGLYRLSVANPADWVVVLNAFAQVWVVTAAEVLVCWALCGEALRATWRGLTGVLAGAVGAAVLFGLYHFAHSAPFNEPRMVLFLMGIGLVTSAFWLASRDVVGTAVFHNFFGVTGVLAAAGDRMSPEPDWVLIATGVAVAGVVAIGTRPAARCG